MRFAKILLRFFFWLFIVLLVCLAAFLFREQRLPSSWVENVASRFVPTNIVIHVDSLAVGLMHGLHIRGLRIYDRERKDPLSPMVSADSVSILFLQRRVTIDALSYPYLPDSYYAPGNLERNAPVEVELPDLPSFSLVLNRPDILGIRPETVVADVDVDAGMVTVNRTRLEWPDRDEPMFVTGFCYVDFKRQEVYGEVEGTAKQHNLRPFIERLDVPVALPYIDNFTDVPSKVPSWCGWKVNLVNNDFDLYLRLSPTLGKYCMVPMRQAEGNIHLHVYTRGTSLNYHHTIGPINAVGPKGEPLSGSVVINATNGYNTVDINARSSLPAAAILKIGGFVGEYVGEDVVGDSECRLQFRFPRAMTNNYEVMDGHGRISIQNGQVMRMKGFRGLVELLADKVPGVSWFTDSTQASCDFVIDHGVIKSDNIYIEGSVFSIKMFGQFDAVNNRLAYTARVQFAKSDSIMGKILHPLAWPFTKLLLEFRLHGTPDKPEWEYVSVIDRVMEVAK